jgi:hypothetical protein
MNRHLPQLIIMSSGAILLLSGIALIVFQMLTQPTLPVDSKAINISPAHLGLETHYVGLVLVAVGAVLEVVGYFGARSWHTNPPST